MPTRPVTATSSSSISRKTSCSSPRRTGHRPRHLLRALLAELGHLESFDYARLSRAGRRSGGDRTRRRRKDGTRFRNTEIHTFRGEKVARVEVYFGWDLDWRLAAERAQERRRADTDGERSSRISERPARSSASPPSTGIIESWSSERIRSAWPAAATACWTKPLAPCEGGPTGFGSGSSVSRATRWANPVRVRLVADVGLLDRAEQLVLEPVGRAGRQQLEGLAERRDPEAELFLGGFEVADDAVACFGCREGHAPRLDDCSAGLGRDPVRPDHARFSERPAAPQGLGEREVGVSINGHCGP